jgi:hypothetical protein
MCVACDMFPVDLWSEYLNSELQESSADPPLMPAPCVHSVQYLL